MAKKGINRINIPKQGYIDFDEYIRQGEPSKKE